jgi:hypothetical protein
MLEFPGLIVELAALQYITCHDDQIILFNTKIRG